MIVHECVYAPPALYTLLWGHAHACILRCWWLGAVPHYEWLADSLDVLMGSGDAHLEGALRAVTIQDQ